MPEKILLVDDDEAFRAEFKEALEGYDVIEAGNGQEALTILKKPNSIDLVLLDVIMPGLSGTDVLRQIKKIDPDIGIIILTGYSSKDVAIEALQAHADDYIEKPLNIERTIEVIERVLDNKRGEGDINTSDMKGKIEKIKHFIERNCYKKICLKDTAEVVCLSPKYLSRIFKQFTGKNFSEYKLEIKITKAKFLLVHTGYNVNQVADKLGYMNVESFIRQFKEHTGFTPTGYRKDILKNKDKVRIRTRLKKPSHKNIPARK
jgi:YesN/AraC family two-component response regulator